MKRPPVLITAVLAVAALVGAGAIGYAIGDNQAPLETMHTGIVYATPYEGTASAGGWDYFLPAHVSWIDASGTIHDAGEHPPCVPFYHASRVTFATVKYSIDGATKGTVVWVRC
jgi:hypothetical protein